MIFLCFETDAFLHLSHSPSRTTVLSKKGYDVEANTENRVVIKGRVTPPSFHPPFVEFHKQ